MVLLIVLFLFRKEESQARQQGPLHQQDVLARGLSHSGPQEPSGREIDSLISFQHFPAVKHFSYHLPNLTTFFFRMFLKFVVDL